jgi:hypothetical protein
MAAGMRIGEDIIEAMEVALTDGTRNLYSLE